MISLITVLLYIFFQLTSSEYCVTIKNTLGICKLDSECSNTVNGSSNILENTRGDLLQGRCGFEGKSLIVCCPIDDESKIDLHSIAKNKGDSEIGDDCTTFDNTPGLCKLSKNCVSSRNSRVSVHNRCGFSGISIIVCCHIESGVRIFSEPISQISRASDKACKLFGKRPEPIESRIVGGRDANQNEFPMFTALGYRTLETKRIAFNCGGVLISNKFILTAAHCCKKRKLPFLARIGKTILNDKDEDYSNSDFFIKVI